MKTKYITCVLVLCSFCGFSQAGKVGKKEPATIVTMGNKQISTTDFMWFYNKYNSYLDDSLRLNFDDAMNLFVDYKMKIFEAERQLLDTSARFKDEFNTYLQAEAKSFLFNTTQADEAFTKMEYERLKKDYHVEHYFVKSSRFAAPADTLAAYNKALKIKKDAQRLGSLNKAIELNTKNDTAAQKKSDDLGYVTALLLPLNYENAIYAAKKGDVVGPIATDYGYYIAKVLDVRPTFGQSQVSIVVFYPDAEKSDSSWAAIKGQAGAAYAKLQAGVDFKTVSDTYNVHPQLKKDVGAIGWVDNSMRFDPQLKEDIFALRNVGDFSEPKKYEYGYVIFYITGREAMPSYQSFQKSVAQSLKTDPSRKNLPHREMLAAQRKLSKMKVNSANVEEFVQKVDNSILLGKWEKPQFTLNKILFTIGDSTYYYNDFAKYLELKQQNKSEADKGILVRKRLEDYQNSLLEQYAMTSLANQNPQFTAIMQEYHDGMIIYELLDKEVFSKVTTDSVGLYNFYVNNPQTAPQSVEFLKFTFSNVKELKAVEKVLNKPTIKVASGIKTLHKNIPTMQIDTLRLSIDDFSTLVKNVPWAKGSQHRLTEKQIVYVAEVFEPHQMSFEESKMQLLPLYQEYLEHEMMKNLREKYPYTINQEVFEAVKNRN
ncbi:MAG: peptidylprolyl isomerase [Bacteroidetes bacterium]|nr:peptidylprolyl isomerase [Bacteroidota bacterium]MCL2329239.1 peptidylprolyl isomerase [Bacteroidota bacterium]